MNKTLLMFISFSFYFIFAFLNLKSNKFVKVNKDLVDKLTFIKKEKNKIEQFSNEDIDFLRKYNLFLDSKNISKSFILNLSFAKDLKSLKKIIKHLEDKGYRAIYYKYNMIYYIAVGYYENFEEAIKLKEEFKEFKNIYPVRF